MRLDGKIAIVTGGGRGIGRGIALAFAREGADVVVAARTEREVTGVAAEVLDLGRRAVPLVADVTQSADVQRVVNTTLETFGRVDILVNNVGGDIPGTVVELSEEQWHAVLDLNLTSTFLCSKYAIPRMQVQGSGSVINISSTRGVSGRRRNAGYGTSKAALIHLTKCMALDFAADGIRVNCICPGSIVTDQKQRLLDAVDDPALFEQLLAELPPERQARFRRYRTNPEIVRSLRGGNAPMNRAGSPDEIGRTAVFLASDDASFITGATIMVDGGRSAGS